MADLQKAKNTALKLGMQPPQGITPGTPDYDNWVQQWFDAGVAAGDPRLIEANGGAGPGSTQAEEGGSIADWKNAAPSSEWMGKRKPTAQELRRWAIETGRSEDYKRYPDAAVTGWINSHWDVAAGSFKNNFGDLVDKPDERGPNTPANSNGTGDIGDYGAGDGGDGIAGGTNGGKNAAPAPPAKPVTFGSQLSMTGNPMQDMLISQFNSGQDPNTYQNNIFGLGEDMRMGGTGRNADQGSTAPTRMGQSLSGGGLWWGQDKDTFSGFDASQKNADPAVVPGTPAIPAAPVVGKKGGRRIGGAHAVGVQNFPTPPPSASTVPQLAMPKRAKPFQGFQGATQPTPLAGMMRGQYNSPARNRPSYF